MNPIVDHDVLDLIFDAIKTAPGVFGATRESECIEFRAPSPHTAGDQRYEIVVREIDEETDDGTPVEPGDRVILSTDDALTMLPDGDTIHTFRQSVSGALLGADWDSNEVIDAIHKAKLCELAGPTATRMGHGLVIYDDLGMLFLATKREEAKK